MTLRQIKKHINISKDKLIEMLYEYVNECKNEYGYMNINPTRQKLYKTFRSTTYELEPYTLRNKDDKVLITYCKVYCGVAIETKEINIFTLGELELIINLI